MRDLHLVKVFSPVNNLVEEPCSKLLLDALMGDDVIEHLPSVCILHDEVDCRRRVENLKQLNNVSMSVPLEDLDFPRDPSDVGNLDDPALLKDLDGHLFTSDYMGPYLDLTKGSLSDRLSKEIVPNGLAPVLRWGGRERGGV